MAVKVFRELKLLGSPPTLKAVLKAIEADLRDGWTRDTEVEKKLEGTDPSQVRCFSCTEKGDRRAADLWLLARSDSEWYVPNVIPAQNPELSYDDYNRILIEFFENYIRPLLDDLKFDIEMTGDELAIEEVLPSESRRLFGIFSRTANKSTGSSHPSDRKRWQAFLIAAHKDEAQLDPTTLQQLLEDNGWPAETALKLAIEYENARDLLEAYEHGDH